MRNGRIVRSIALILTSASLFAVRPIRAAEPPSDLLRKIAAAETVTAAARDNYTYRQSVTVDEFDHRDMIDGQFREVRDITFSPTGSRYEQPVGRVVNTLQRIRMTPEDFADIRNVQPFFLTSANVRQYSGKYLGDETIDGIPCFVEHVEPKQILSGQRFFDGTLWVRQSDFAVVRSQGQAVPQIETLRQQNLFPHFTTLWKEIDGKWMFPVETYADDTLFFRDWPQRIRITIRYMNYKRFGAESTLTFEGEAEPQPSNSPAQPQQQQPPK
ncbi:MAG: hypothetical protein JOZ62_14480 [Acidobacteriaceae bacterium]|nr:hypothetical protein [Acidobacteriaceae bacterium]